MPRLATILLLLACGCAPEPTAPELFDAIWTDVDTRYGGFAQRGVDWDALGDTWSAGLRADSDEDALWDAVTGMLAELDDGHVLLEAPDRLVFHSNRVYREAIDDGAFDLDAIRDGELGGDYETDDLEQYTWGRLVDDPGVAYLHLPYVSDNTPIVSFWLDGERDADALILDLRHCFGGDFTWPLVAFAPFTDRVVPVFRSRTRNGPERDDFSAWTTWKLEPEGRVDARPMVVLTDRYTISAAERAVLMLAPLPQVTLVGTPTNGSQGTMTGRVMPNGWVLTLPVQEVEAPDGTVYEGVGIPPAVEVLADEALLAEGRDTAIEAAVAVLRAP